MCGLIGVWSGTGTGTSTGPTPANSNLRHAVIVSYA